MNVIGISAHFHDAACCLLQDGKLVAAAEEERFTRIKHDPSIPKHAFRYCLKEGGISINDIDCIAYYENPQKKLSRQLWMGLPDISFIKNSDSFRMDSQRPIKEIRNILGYDGRVEFFDHHLSHAASSYFYSGFSDAAILTVDAVGEWATTSYGHATGTEISILEDVSFPHSLGMLYSTITAYMGFEVNEGEYKVMGLAPYGEARYVDRIWKLIENFDDGSFKLRMRYFDFVQGSKMYSDDFCELMGRPAREPESTLDIFWNDLAKSIQVVLEQILLQKVRYLRSKVSSDRLCLAGGVALNCVANAHIRREGGFSELFIQPAAGDSGSCLGAAALAYVRLTGQHPSLKKLRHVYLGPGFSATEISKMFEATSASPLNFQHNEQGLLEAVIDRLTAGKVIGWFQGRMEFGPRALGARSILADPRVSNMREKINSVIKQRELFRPFAPSVLEEETSNHFDLSYSSPFMLETCAVTSAFGLPAITHVDGSARVQTVNQEDSPRYYKLIKQFAERTGCPILLNTSFNVRGEPIVCSPLEALMCFLRSDMDCLVLEDLVIDRCNVPNEWLEWFKNSQPVRLAGIKHTNYTLL